VLAITIGQELGVDVEYLLSPEKTVNIAESFFSPIEVQHLFTLPAKKRTDRFFDLWTLKEAYIKACGMGLSIPLDHVSFSFPRQEEISISFKPERDNQPEYWQFWQISPNDIHKVSMAIKTDKINVSYSITIREIVPLIDMVEVHYPIVMSSSFSCKN
jgi:4'-phosphopantetheinyl transferase